MFEPVMYSEMGKKARWRAQESAESEEPSMNLGNLKSSKVYSSFYGESERERNKDE